MIQGLTNARPMQRLRFSPRVIAVPLLDAFVFHRVPAPRDAMVTSGIFLGSLAGNGAAPHSNCGLYLLMKLYIQTPCNSIATCPARNGSEGEAKFPKVAPNRRRLLMPYLSVVLRNHSKVS